MKKQFENDVEWFESMQTDAFRRRRFFGLFKQKVDEYELDTQIRSALKNNDFEFKIKLDPNPESQKYAAVMATKSTDGRAYTYAIVDLATMTAQDSFCQFDSYTDLLINLSLHLKIGEENEGVMQAVSYIIRGALK